MRFGVIDGTSSSSSEDDDVPRLPSSPPLMKRYNPAKATTSAPGSDKHARRYEPTPVVLSPPPLSEVGSMSNWPQPRRMQSGSISRRRKSTGSRRLDDIQGHSRFSRSKSVTLSPSRGYSGSQTITYSSDEEGSSGSSDGFDDEQDTDSESAHDTDDDTDDSEEEEWPVKPMAGVGVHGWRHDREAPRRRTRPWQSRILEGGSDPLDAWDEQARANSWAAANRSFHLSLARARPAVTGAAAAPGSSKSATTSANDVSNLLSQLSLQQAAAHTALVNAFASRHEALWTSIEAAIAQAEREERALEENRAKEREAALKAQEAREKAVKEEKDRAERDKAEAERRVQKEKEETEKKKREAEEATAKAQEAAASAAKQAAALGASTGGEGSPQAEYERWTAKMLHIKSTVLPAVSQNPAWRKQCFTAKRAITPKIGQLTASAEATLRIITQLNDLLVSLRAEATCYTWALNHLAKALVKQAETEVTARLGTAYPLGRVVIGLLLRGHDELGDVLMARLVKKCFWLTGWWPPKKPDQSDEDHQKALGHAPPNAGESLVQYAQRMSGIVALYGAIIQTSPLDQPQAIGPASSDTLRRVPPHFRPSSGWRMLVLLLRPPLVALEPTPLLIVTLLEIAGPRLVEVYGRQMRKVLEALLREGCRDDSNAVFSDKARSSRMRLLLWLEEWEKTGQCEEVPGRRADP